MLKVARGPEFSSRLADEADVLRKLRHQYIVEVDRTVQLSGLTGILMQRAGNETLAKRISDEGKLHPDLLQRFGEDLLVTIDWLEQKGVPHRDIKPDNIGVMPVGRGNELHLVLFDFSLARTPAENIRAGTSRYMDPFLTVRKPQRWDLPAERWSAAATLYEMATGDLPKWGDGRSDPSVLTSEATIDGEKFDAEVRDGLLPFFAKAFRRDPTQRFDNCRDMLKAWRDAFLSATRLSHTQDSVASPDLDKSIANCTLDTPVASLGLFSRAVTALDRLSVNTVRELLQVPTKRIYKMKGVGNKTRRHLAEAVTKLRARFPDVQPSATADSVTTTDGDSGDVVRSVELLVQSITGGRPSKEADLESQAIRAFLNLDRLDTPARGYWPTQTDIGKQMKVSTARVNQWIDSARRRWLKNKSVTFVRDELLEILESQGGVMSAAELAGALLATRGSTLREPQRSLLASAAVRAAVEAERGLVQPRLATRRRGELNLVAKAYDEEDPNALCDYAVRVGDEADKLAGAEPLVTPQRAIESLRRIKRPEKSPYIDDTRLLKLAAAASNGAAVSSRMEIYPRGMAASRALKLAVGALSGSTEVTLDQIRERVSGRYPGAEPLPTRPEIDHLLKEAGWTLRWDEGKQAYVLPTEVLATTTFTSTLPRYGTANTVSLAVSPEVAEARDFDDRLRRSLQSGSFIALSVAPRHVQRCAGDMADRFGLDVRSLDDLVIKELQRQASIRKVDWSVVLKADADGSTGRDWQKLQLLVKAAVAEVEKQVLAMDRPVILMYPGLIARYEQLQFLEHLRDGSGRDGSVPGIWLILAATDHQKSLPTIDNRPVPVLGHGQWAWVPDAWLTNEHRGHVETPS